MKNYVVLYHALLSAMHQMANASPEQSKAGMDAWMAWAAKAGNRIGDLGAPLGNGRSITANSVSGSAASVVGYSILQAGSMDEVTELLKEHPHLRMPEFSIEVFEALPLPGA